MSTIRTIAYISIALLIVGMLAMGAVSAKAGSGENGEKANNGICDRDRIRDRTCDSEFMSSEPFEPKDHSYKNYHGHCHSET